VKPAALAAIVGLSLCCGCHKSQPATPPLPAPPLARQRPQRRSAPRSQPATPALAQPKPAAQPAPRLGRLLSPAEQQSYNQAIDQALQHARGAIELMRGRQLSREQQDTAGQVRAFIDQAEEARKSDLIAAKGLADKAELIARDLTNSLR
jgi:hypothetical protein